MKLPLKKKYIRSEGNLILLVHCQTVYQHRYISNPKLLVKPRYPLFKDSFLLRCSSSITMGINAFSSLLISHDCVLSYISLFCICTSLPPRVDLEITCNHYGVFSVFFSLNYTNEGKNKSMFWSLKWRPYKLIPATKHLDTSYFSPSTIANQFFAISWQLSREISPLNQPSTTC